MKVENLMQASFVDLSHTLDEDVPTWTGHCGFRSEVRIDYEEGLRVQTYRMHAGIGTHMDAPSHFCRDGLCIGDIHLENLIVPAVVIDVSVHAELNYLVSLEDVVNYEKAYGKIASKALVLIYTGWDRFWHHKDLYRACDEKGKMHFPGVGVEAIDLLLEREIVGIGIDTLSPDGSHENFPVHEKVLGSGKYILENLNNLEKMPPKGAFVISLCPKIRHGTEAAARVIGIIPN